MESYQQRTNRDCVAEFFLIYVELELKLGSVISKI